MLPNLPPPPRLLTLSPERPLTETRRFWFEEEVPEEVRDVVISALLLDGRRTSAPVYALEGSWLDLEGSFLEEARFYQDGHETALPFALSENTRQLSCPQAGWSLPVQAPLSVSAPGFDGSFFSLSEKTLTLSFSRAAPGGMKVRVQGQEKDVSGQREVRFVLQPGDFTLELHYPSAQTQSWPGFLEASLPETGGALSGSSSVQTWPEKTSGVLSVESTYLGKETRTIVHDKGIVWQDPPAEEITSQPEEKPEEKRLWLEPAEPEPQPTQKPAAAKSAAEKENTAREEKPVQTETKKKEEPKEEKKAEPALQDGVSDQKEDIEKLADEDLRQTSSYEGLTVQVAREDGRLSVSVDKNAPEEAAASGELEPVLKDKPRAGETIRVYLPETGGRSGLVYEQVAFNDEALAPDQIQSGTAGRAYVDVKLRGGSNTIRVSALDKEGQLFEKEVEVEAERNGKWLWPAGLGSVVSGLWLVFRRRFLK